ncbi:DUF305 domain-containing protein [Mesorhizobium denitrificans]|jgi:uncharacterized protein (DUF305 family)|uniref:DUF305 domain-containing protein n=1 Tax=Mesorhizobium denitrificans TaxID=2294114 RepID=A0A371X9C0_9HYPH|nr:DUF305 domain-containing protein [Mesorhizobium denitrificans]RFC65825.1 DUF305 domain-containing protein [Mesorhizobium denitrificans]
MEKGRGHEGHSGSGMYGRFAVELAVDFVIMYLVMYTMIATLDDFYPNLNNVYMTLMMVAPMAIVMLVSMRSMFPSRNANLAIIAVAAAVLAGSFYGMRAQAAIDDEEFLRAMIPHHSGAVLMCEQASLKDPEIIELCGQIVPAQQEEIAVMKAILERI